MAFPPRQSLRSISEPRFSGWNAISVFRRFVGLKPLRNCDGQRLPDNIPIGPISVLRLSALLLLVACAALTPASAQIAPVAEPMAEQAAEGGADYVAFGRFFPSRTKPQAPPADSAILQQARKRLAIPLVAIGGIDPSNGDQLLKLGADALAVIHALFSDPAPDQVERAAQQLSALF